MNGQGVILYGPPASGKDTITAALHTEDQRCELFPRLKVGGGRTAGYRITDTARLDQLRQAGAIAWENSRYGSVYAVDTPELVKRLQGTVPVLHLGQVQALDAIARATPGAHWVVVQLWCPREVAAARIKSRRTGDTEARLAAWDATARLPSPELDIDTSQVSPEDAAKLIAERLRGPAQ